jgi:hypothetical protein
MTLHLVKLCVGVASPADLRAHIGRRPGAVVGHSTKSTPTRGAEIAGKGSLYWVMKGRVACRQAVLGFEKSPDGQRCVIVLSPDVVDVEPRQRKMFQGWRYLTAEDAPPDLTAEASAGIAAMPESLRRELVSMGLL